MNKAIQEIRGTDSAELKGKLTDLRKEEWELRFQGTGEGASTSRRRVVRRTIARILTILRERQAAEAGGK